MAWHQTGRGPIRRGSLRLSVDKPLFLFGDDGSCPDGGRVNKMDRPVLIDYYEKALATWMS